MKMAIYGLGAMGMRIVQSFLEKKIPIAFIVDRQKAGTFFEGVPVISLEHVTFDLAEDTNLLVALHNHYVDLKTLHSELAPLKFKSIITLAGLWKLFPQIEVEGGYWLQAQTDRDEHRSKCEEFLNLLSDDKSIHLAKSILKFRTSGSLEDYPYPSMSDEYAPVDLPRYSEPIRLIDCGAYTGTAIHRFLQAGYAVDAVAAFEPDPESFRKLSANDFPIAEKQFFPMGTWSVKRQFRFSNKGSMASNIDPLGSSTIDCVAIDEVLSAFHPNLIKLDVEGAEFDTLIGARNIISSDLPSLCISIYHSAEDFYRLGLLIHSWGLNYKFYLRLHEHNTFGAVLYCRQ